MIVIYTLWYIQENSQQYESTFSKMFILKNVRLVPNIIHSCFFNISYCVYFSSVCCLDFGLSIYNFLILNHNLYIFIYKNTFLENTNFDKHKYDNIIMTLK